jgi:hypothetical protein
MAAFWDVAPCSLVEVDQRFRGAYCIHHQEGHFENKLNRACVPKIIFLNLNNSTFNR